MIKKLILAIRDFSLDKNKERKFSNLSVALVVLIAIILFSFVVKGDKGDPIAFQSTHDTRVGGPFELTNSSSRYALTESIVNQRTFLFDDDKARFAAPDLVHYNGRFFSIFTPGVSFIGIPFYIVGKYLGIPQLLTYFSTHLFALLNTFLISFLTIKLGGKTYHGMLGGLIFLFGTNALAYSLTFTQHHASTFLVLLGILNALGKRTFVNNIVFGGIFGVGILVDIPNIFLLLPVTLYIIYKNFVVEGLTDKIRFGLKIGIIGLVIGLIPFLFLFGFYNYQTAGSYTKIAQFIGRSDYPQPINKAEIKDVKVEEKNSQQKLLDIPFDTRLQLNGLYILLLSNERGIFYYSPILLAGVLGLFIAARDKKYKNASILAVSVIGMNVVLYSMFGDPWGGWAFGPRYLIPTSALLCIGIGVCLKKIRHPIFLTIFLAVLCYSVWVNVLGALTTSSIPPKVEAQNLLDPIPYTYKYNLQIIEKNQSSSLLYNLYLNQFMSVKDYFYFYSSAIIIIVLILSAIYLRKEVE